MKTLLVTLSAVALFMMVHVFGLPLLPDTARALAPAEMLHEPGAESLAYSVPFPYSASDTPHDRRSRVTLYEDGHPLSPHADAAGVAKYGRGNYAHIGDRLIFSATDNGDPRIGGRSYEAYYPILYQRGYGYLAAIVFALSLIVLRRMRPTPAVIGTEPRPPDSPVCFRRHVAGAAVVLLLGLYCSTGTLAPYGNHTHPFVATSYQFVYNPDHEHFRVLFQFVDGQPRSTWDGALFTRRILFPVLAYPFMKIWGFEIGGAIASLVFSTAALVGFLFGLRRFLGTRTTIYAGWILALYPGAAYWGGLPYVYSAIFPACLLLTLGLLALRASDSPLRTVWVSLLMGTGYLGYDLVVFFLPVSLFVLLARRRVIDAVLAAACQLAPLVAWLAFLRLGLSQDLTNSNSATFGVILNAYRHLSSDFNGWRELARLAPAIGLNTFFGSGFVFLSTLFLVVLLLNALATRLRFTSVELGLLGVGVALFLFNNLAPAYDSAWQMRGPWISRIYQPVFPALVLYCARSLAALPPLGLYARRTLGATLLALGLGNALVIFGPVLNNPLAVSENVFFAFYDSKSPRSFYQGNLEKFGRRPLGFRPSEP